MKRPQWNCGQNPRSTHFQSYNPRLAQWCSNLAPQRWCLCWPMTLKLWHLWADAQSRTVRGLPSICMIEHDLHQWCIGILLLSHCRHMRLTPEMKSSWMDGHGCRGFCWICVIAGSTWQVAPPVHLTKKFKELRMSTCGEWIRGITKTIDEQPSVLEIFWNWFQDSSPKYALDFPTLHLFVINFYFPFLIFLFVFHFIHHFTANHLHK